MRVISGSAKGRKLKAPKTDIRPLSDRAKEALFNIIREKVDEASFLDVFAGSGNVGIEALSRGAKLAIFIENDRRHVSVIKENLENLGFYDRAEVYSLDALQALKILALKSAKFDIIFLGAPYNNPVLVKSLELLGENAGENLGGGLVIAEYRFKQEVGGEYGKLKRVREEKYGDTMLGFYEKI